MKARGLLSVALSAGLVVAVATPHAVADPLPPGYGLEKVGPDNSYGQAVLAGGVAPDGNAIRLTSVGAMEDADNAPDLGGSFYAERSPLGWNTVPQMPPATLFPTWATSSAQGLDFTADFKTSLWWVQKLEDKNTQRYTPVLSHLGGTHEVAGPTVDDGVGSGLGSTLLATSADLRTLVIRSTRRNLTTDGSVDTRPTSRNGLYVSRPASSVPGGFDVRQVAYRAGAPMLTNCSVTLGSERTARGSVSDDGQKIFFWLSGLPSCVSATNQRVWLKEGTEDARDVSASRCTVDCGTAAPTFFEGASFDGKWVYFATEQKLIDSDLDTSARADLYLHDSTGETEELVAVTSNGETGEGAGIVGVVRATDDGSHVYFVANGRPLAGENARGETPQPGENNLYVYHRARGAAASEGTFKFIAALSSDDVNRSTQYSLLNAQNRPVVTSRDGRYMLFLSRSDLAGDKLPGDGHRDMFRYDSEADELTRIWVPNPEHNGTERIDGVEPNIGPREYGEAATKQTEKHRYWMMSEDGAVIAFATAERLSPDDINSKRDAYMWQEETGAITMLTDGRSSWDLGPSSVTSSGDVVFLSDRPLLPEHRSGAITVFVARKGGGFATQAPPPPPCRGDSCQKASSQPPLAPGLGSVAFTGDANIGPATRRGTVSVTRLRRVTGARGALRVRVPAAGRVTVRGPLLRSSTRRAAGATRLSLPVVLNARAKRGLRARSSLRVRLQVTFNPVGAAAQKRTLTAVFVRPQARRRGAK